MQMKTVALVSGGKDSCYNMMHCVVNGHEIVALANLHPPGPSDDSDEVLHEMDSFMYQTVGHSVLRLYSQCMGVPMYRGEIKGKTVDAKLEYSPTSADETEDLYNLLADVKAAHPDVQAVSVGAILSTYQRTRVESVCSRLGLTSLAYLWNRDEAKLFDEMIDAGVNAIIIKVAGEGLSQRHLGTTLQDVRPHLLKAHSLYKAHICGEGGEYETLVLDCPLFVRKLVIDSKEIVAEPTGSVAYLKVVAHVEEKDLVDNEWQSHVTVPSLLDDDIAEAMQVHVDASDIGRTHTATVERVPESSMKRSSGGLVLTNITVANSPSIGEEVDAIFAKVAAAMTALGDSDPTQISSVTLLLSDMADFASANAAYKQHFVKPLPPVRACVATILPAGCRASVSVVITPQLRFRKGIHVQGRSYWAPANIGPYSQGIKYRECLYLAGQIPLIPSSMTIYQDKGLVGQAALALQNLHRVALTLNNAEPEEFYTPKFFYTIAFTVSRKASQIAIQFANHFLNGSIFAVQVTALPAGASIEYSGVAVDSTYEESGDSDDESDSQSRKLNTTHNPCGYTEVAYCDVWYRSLCIDVLEPSHAAWNPGNGSLLFVTLYVSSAVCTDYEPIDTLRSRLNAALEIIYVHSVTDSGSNLRNYGVLVRGHLSPSSD